MWGKITFLFRFFFFLSVGISSKQKTLYTPVFFTVAIHIIETVIIDGHSKNIKKKKKKTVNIYSGGAAFAYYTYDADKDGCNFFWYIYYVHVRAVYIRTIVAIC